MKYIFCLDGGKTQENCWKCIAFGVELSTLKSHVIDQCFVFFANCKQPTTSSEKFLKFLRLIAYLFKRA